MSSTSLPAGIEIQIEIRLTQGDELLQHGVLLIGETDEAKDFQLVGLAAQRGVYELLRQLWLQYQQLEPSGVDRAH